jgi:hypothetical protein
LSALAEALDPGLKKAAAGGPPSSSRYRDLKGAASIAAPDGRLSAAAVKIATLDAQVPLEPIDLKVELGELAAAKPVAAGAMKPILDPVRLAAQAERLAWRDDAPTGRAVDTALDPVDTLKELPDRAAVRLMPAMAGMGGGGNRGQGGGREGGGNKQLTHLNYSLAAQFAEAGASPGRLLRC